MEDGLNLYGFNLIKVYFKPSNHVLYKVAINRLFQSFEKNRANLANKFSMLWIRSKLRKSGAYWGHCNTYSSIVLKSARDTMVPGVRKRGQSRSWGQSWGH